LMGQIVERAEPRIGNQHHVTSAAAVTASGAAKRDVFFAPKRDRTLATGTGFDSQLALINETHRTALDLALLGRGLTRIARGFGVFLHSFGPASLSAAV